MSNRSTTSLKLDAEIKTRLQQLAQARRRSSHWLMREAIEQYVEREERREKVREKCEASPEECKQRREEMRERRQERSDRFCAENPDKCDGK